MFFKFHNMKKLIFITFLLLGTFYFSQTVSEKYNSITKRYEYFDSSGNMIGYKSYNSLSQQWEYYDLKNSQYRMQNSRQPYQYSAPAQVDISPLGDAASVLQGRYDSNSQKIMNTLKVITEQINELDISENQRTLIIKTFFKHFEDNQRNFNLNSTSETNGIVNWLFDSANKIIRNVTSSKSRNVSTSGKSDEMSDFYDKILNVYRIAIYHPRTSTFSPDEKIINKSYIVLKDNEILFRRADGSESYRNLANRKYNKNKDGYEYSSNVGAVFIHKNLDYVEFFDHAEPTGDRYTYFIWK